MDVNLIPLCYILTFEITTVTNNTFLEKNDTHKILSYVKRCLQVQKKNISSCNRNLSTLNYRILFNMFRPRKLIIGLRERFEQHSDVGHLCYYNCSVKHQPTIYQQGLRHRCECDTFILYPNLFETQWKPTSHCIGK